MSTPIGNPATEEVVMDPDEIYCDEPREDDKGDDNDHELPKPKAAKLMVMAQSLSGLFERHNFSEHPRIQHPASV